MKKRVSAAVLILLCCLSLAASAGAQCPMTGSWAFSHDPDTVVLRVEENGRAMYQGKTYGWTDDGTFLVLTDGAGEALRLRYLVTEETVFIYPVTVYEKTGYKDQPGIIGVWEGTGGSGSNFVFTPAGAFLEDSTFTGRYLADEEEGTFLLRYGELFDDTLCYYTLDGEGLLTVEYPFPVVRVP